MYSTTALPTPPSPLGRENYVDQYVAARFLCIEPITVLRKAREGRIPGHPMGTGPRRIWRFLLSELDEWLRSQVALKPPSVSSSRRQHSMRTKQQKGSLKRVRRPGGSEVWILRWREAQADGSRRPRKVVIGSVKDIRSESAAWLQVQQLGYGLTGELVGTPRPNTFGKLIEHFTEKELPELDDPQDEGRSLLHEAQLSRLSRQEDCPAMGESSAGIDQGSRGGRLASQYEARTNKGQS